MGCQRVCTNGRADGGEIMGQLFPPFGLEQNLFDVTSDDVTIRTSMTRSRYRRRGCRFSIAFGYVPEDDGDELVIPLLPGEVPQAAELVDWITRACHESSGERSGSRRLQSKMSIHVHFTFNGIGDRRLPDFTLLEKKTVIRTIFNCPSNKDVANDHPPRLANVL